VWIHGRDSSVGIAANYRLDGPGSILRISRLSFVLFSYVLLTSLCINVFAFCILHYLCITVYVLFIAYITPPPGINPIAVGNKYIKKPHTQGQM
jgi:hypothetical protein